jgi:hypothetical protein
MAQKIPKTLSSEIIFYHPNKCRIPFTVTISHLLKINNLLHFDFTQNSLAAKKLNERQLQADSSENQKQFKNDLKCPRPPNLTFASSHVENPFCAVKFKTIYSTKFKTISSAKLKTICSIKFKTICSAKFKATCSIHI